MQKYNGRRPVFNFGRLILHFCNSLLSNFFFSFFSFLFLFLFFFLIGTTLTTEPLGGFPGNTRGRSRALVKFPYPIVRVYVQAYKQIQHCQSLLNIPEPTAAVAAVKEHYYLCLITCVCKVGHSTVQSTPYIVKEIKKLPQFDLQETVLQNRHNLRRFSPRIIDNHLLENARRKVVHFG